MSRLKTSNATLLHFPDCQIPFPAYSGAVLNHHSGWKIAVQPARNGGYYIVAPNTQVDAICQVLTENTVAHAVEESCIRLEGMSLETLIRIGSGEDPEHVQGLLDAADDVHGNVSIDQGQAWYW